ncbi:hypothetical protein PDJAM_G00258530 [Pangasius djambal]|uniref:Uncharacterized protein n=1 Tax=Pangasius djambal TaxID=1691987 RepID=A0ACC5YKX0_9TELE|nr:hypothetical protein [Pangasius djambal]
MDLQRWIIFLKIFIYLHLKKESHIHLGWHEAESLQSLIASQAKASRKISSQHLINIQLVFWKFLNQRRGSWKEAF